MQRRWREQGFEYQSRGGIFVAGSAARRIVEEAPFTGTGFPKVFYLKYHLYRDYFPVYALARCRNLAEGRSEYHAVEYQPTEFRHRKLPKERRFFN